ncbi:MAG: phosphoribosylformylglycinamidine synthase I [Candidatus Neomarinimicrobiota bacterium]|nr:MAG: phosphoribosylformylglycinamidine synthase I [Candidatus Neomarinimicrobiota bacterium]HDN60162.1 phosphoribosylformylglycinamidine synthase I [Candidatus Neomarinimicrobiota bacterium]
MRVGVVIFPGSNCDYDTYYVFKDVLKVDVSFIWHTDSDLRGYDAVILPGGFSYGDYLRAGAIARFSPVMREIVRFAKRGNPVMGICNGFQILLEAELLPGALIPNNGMRFRCEDVYIRVVNNDSIFTRGLDKGRVLKMPIAHYSGNYYADEGTIKSLEDNEQIVFQYCNSAGEVLPEANPNGSILNIAGIVNREGNILGMMPHPERASEKVLGSEDGVEIFKSLMGKV